MFKRKILLGLFIICIFLTSISFATKEIKTYLKTEEIAWGSNKIIDNGVIVEILEQNLSENEVFLKLLFKNISFEDKVVQYAIEEGYKYRDYKVKLDKGEEIVKIIQYPIKSYVPLKLSVFINGKFYDKDIIVPNYLK